MLSVAYMRVGIKQQCHFRSDKIVRCFFSLKCPICLLLLYCTFAKKLFLGMVMFSPLKGSMRFARHFLAHMFAAAVSRHR